MSTARLSHRALRALTSTSTSKTSTTTRSLSITGPTTFSSLLTSDKPPASRRLPSSPSVPDTNDAGKPARHFNTSRSLKAVNDSSTIDFMYIPEFVSDKKGAPVEIRVPIMPSTQTSRAVREEHTEAETPVMMPTIYTVSADGTHIHAPSAMSEVGDSDGIDFQGLASEAAQKVVGQVQRAAGGGEGMTRQILSDMLEDILGPRKGGARM